MLFTNGATFSDISTRPECSFAFQKAVVTTQMHLEDTFAMYAESTGEPSVLLCDRGTMDGKAYMSDEAWISMLKCLNLEQEKICGDRYDAVFHLVTAAEGASDHYTLDNNLTRTEGLEQAVQLDHRSREVWSSHPHQYIIDNSSPNFDCKMLALTSKISDILHTPVPVSSAHYCYKLMQSPTLSLLPSHRKRIVEIITISNTVTASLLLSSQISSQTEDNNDIIERKSFTSICREEETSSLSTYFVTVITKHTDGRMLEWRKIITEDVHATLLKCSSGTCAPITAAQTRYYFQFQSLSAVLVQHSPSISADVRNTTSDWSLYLPQPIVEENGASGFEAFGAKLKRDTQWFENI
eukprot:CAMPEP_0182440976 /NCGR_PEP_ID=MMETSP1167-20130531/87414_1 /TAXON_ID=2988 /ORGANISM="Mallomonas Sp, Strain CCMP3275" /LENGTH=352 /DNA_ID=CAMNT_0024635095 /DNA_START=124 /DNA_END=1182 /DNA_ORIENTATION=+